MFLRFVGVVVVGVTRGETEQRENKKALSKLDKMGSWYVNGEVFFVAVVTL